MSLESPSKLRGLRRGNPGNHGGGRKPWAFREEMREALSEGFAGQVIRRIICGDIQEEIGTTKDGEPIYGSTKNADRIKAIQLAAAYAEGLPVQPTVDLTPRAPVELTTNAIWEALPRLLTVMPEGSQQIRQLQAISVDAEVVE